MARIEDLADRFGRHIATPWQRTVSGAQRVVMLVYDKELERTLRARKVAFETATRQAGEVTQSGPSMQRSQVRRTRPPVTMG